jgi:hypothetical protein
MKAEKKIKCPECGEFVASIASPNPRVGHRSAIP